mmetsp:Transcript_5445/g.10993  ORF Transcript_5445/g.10993 Transcript_5445/m.10993 type:complete len:170 (+) Transcript_5445:429-938(+)
MKIDIHPEDDIPITEQNIRLRRRNTFHRTKMIKVCVSEFVDSHDNFIDAHFDFGIPYHILSADSHEKQALRIRRSSEDPHCYSISAMVDAKSWLRLGEIDLDDVMDYAQDGEGMLSVLLNIVVTDEMMLEVEPTWHDEIGSPFKIKLCSDHLFIVQRDQSKIQNDCSIL